MTAATQDGIKMRAIIGCRAPWCVAGGHRFSAAPRRGIWRDLRDQQGRGKAWHADGRGHVEAIQQDYQEVKIRRP